MPSPSADISQALVDKAEEMNLLEWGDSCPPEGWTPVGCTQWADWSPDKALFFSPGAVWLRSIREACLAKISGGQIVTLTNANVNGESFTKQIDIDPASLLNQAAVALRELLGTEVRITYSMFRNIPL